MRGERLGHFLSAPGIWPSCRLNAGRPSALCSSLGSTALLRRAPFPATRLRSPSPYALTCSGLKPLRLLPLLLVIWAPSVLLPDVWSWWLGRARLSGSAFSFSVAEWLGTSPRLVGELLLLSGSVERPGGRTARRAKARAGAPPFYGPVHRLLNEQTEVSPLVGYLTSQHIHQRPART